MLRPIYTTGAFLRQSVASKSYGCLFRGKSPKEPKQKEGG